MIEKFNGIFYFIIFLIHFAGLGLLSNKQSTLQIKKSFSFFKKRINLNLKHYSYPEGRKIDYNKLVISRLKSRGIKLCPTAIEGKNNLNTGLFDLKRVLI